MSYAQPQRNVLLSTQTASSSASLQFTNFLNTTLYKFYLIELNQIVPATNTAGLLITLSTNGGSSYLSSAYKWTSNITFGTNTGGGSGSTSDSSMKVYALGNSTATTLGGCGFLNFYGLGQSTQCQYQGLVSLYDSNSNLTQTNATGCNTGTTAINAIKFAFSSGNIASGTLYLYGVTTT